MSADVHHTIPSSSLHESQPSMHEGSTIDDLTAVLASFSRAQSPDPTNVLSCCCGREECEHLRTWLEFKSKLESRLVLSAEVGQALLQKHEAYMRQHEAKRIDTEPSSPTASTLATETHDARDADLVQATAALERRLAQALVNAEVAESANATLTRELNEARSNVVRLTAHQARTIGWDARLRNAVQEREDLQQERDSEAHRARMAEQRSEALKDKCSKLQSDVRKLQRDLQQQRQHRLELSEEILQDARSRLEMLQSAQIGHTVSIDDSEVTRIMETLVADNEDLKRSNAELQNLLTEARDDMHTLLEEVAEQRAMSPSKPSASERTLLRHRHTTSTSSVFSDISAGLAPSIGIGTATAMSTPISPRSQADSSRTLVSHHLAGTSKLHAETDSDRRPVSPTDSLVPSEAKWTSFAPRFPGVSSDDTDLHRPPPDHHKQAKSLFLLSREKAVQTDAWPSLLSPSPALSDRVPSFSPGEGRSEESSLADSNQSSAMSALLERVSTLFNRLSQADVLTLTNRLKRQHLGGADMVGHLSRTTVESIVQEASTLRVHFRAILEDDKAVMACTRKDLRALFKIVKDVFFEMGLLRMTLNDIIIEPTIAVKVREHAMDPSKAEAVKGASEAPSGWMAPIAKLFGAPAQPNTVDSTAKAPSRPSLRGRGGAPFRPPSKLAPKSGPALSASGTTVNVEFSGSGVGRAVSNSIKEPPRGLRNVSTPVSSGLSKNVMDIFAGAPRAAADPWVVVPKSERPPQPRRLANLSAGESATIGRASLRNLGTGGAPNPNRFSRNVDAIIDAVSPDTSMNNEDSPEGDGFHPRLLERTLRPRGLSDSSIRSTFLQHGEQGEQQPSQPEPQSGGPQRRETWQERQSIMQAFGRKVQQSFFGAVPSNSSSPALAADAASNSPSAPRPVKGARAADDVERTTSPGISSYLPSLHVTGWPGASTSDLEAAEAAAAGFHYESTRDDSRVHRAWSRETQGR